MKCEMKPTFSKQWLSVFSRALAINFLLLFLIEFLPHAQNEEEKKAEKWEKYK